MKILVNKNNPEIRITAPEIRKCLNLYYSMPGCTTLFSPKEWTLIEERSGIRGKSRGIPAIKSKEIKSKLISAVKAQFYPGPEKEQIIQWIQNANL